MDQTKSKPCNKFDPFIDVIAVVKGILRFLYEFKGLFHNFRESFNSSEGMIYNYGQNI